MELEGRVRAFEMELDELKKRVTALEAPPETSSEADATPIATAEELDNLAVRVKILEETAASTPGAKPSLVIVKDDGSAIRDEQLCPCGKIVTLKTIVSDKNKLTRWFHKPGEACAKVFAELHH